MESTVQGMQLSTGALTMVWTPTAHQPHPLPPAQPGQGQGWPGQGSRAQNRWIQLPTQLHSRARSPRRHPPLPPSPAARPSRSRTGTRSTAYRSPSPAATTSSPRAQGVAARRRSCSQRRNAKGGPRGLPALPLPSAITAQGTPGQGRDTQRAGLRRRGLPVHPSRHRCSRAKRGPMVHHSTAVALRGSPEAPGRGRFATTVFSVAKHLPVAMMVATRRLPAAKMATAALPVYSSRPSQPTGHAGTRPARPGRGSSSLGTLLVNSITAAPSGHFPHDDREPRQFREAAALSAGPARTRPFP